MWCILQELNAQTFEIFEMTTKELETTTLNSSVSMAASNSSQFTTFLDFNDFPLFFLLAS